LRAARRGQSCALRGRPARGIDPLQGGYERCQSDSRLAWIRDALDDRVLACEPPAERPMAGVALGGHPVSRAGPGWQVAGAGQVSAAKHATYRPALWPSGCAVVARPCRRQLEHRRPLCSHFFTLLVDARHCVQRDFHAFGTKRAKETNDDSSGSNRPRRN
jgi:hypothetical protein